MRTRTEYVCELCNTVYGTATEASACEARGLEANLVNVGDIVTGRAGYGWFDGDARWISNPQVARDGVPQAGGISVGNRNPKHGNCFGDCCTYAFYYVVTAIDHVRHEVRYHLATKAMTGKEGHRLGYTFNNGHARPVLVAEPPQAIIDDSRDLIGQKATTLW